MHVAGGPRPGTTRSTDPRTPSIPRDVTSTRDAVHDCPRLDVRGLIRLLREDARTNGQITRPGFQAVAVHRFGVWRLHLRGLPRVVADLVYRTAHCFVRNVYGIELFYTTRVGRRLEIGHQGGIVIHPR